MTVVVTSRAIDSSSRLALSSRPTSKRLWSWYTLTDSLRLTRRSSS